MIESTMSSLYVLSSTNLSECQTETSFKQRKQLRKLVFD